MSVEIASKLKQMQNLPFAQRKSQFDALLKTHGVIETFAAIYEVWGAFPPASFLKSLRDFDVFPPHKTTQIKTIGFITRNFGLGGVERVMVTQLDLFRKMGIKCVLFTENEYVEGKTFPIHDTVKHVVFPHDPDIRAREAALNEAIKTEKIDAFLFPMISVEYTLVDVAVIRLLHQLPCIAHYHHCCFLHMWNTAAGRILEQRSLLLSFMDLEVVLSKVDAVYFNLTGAKACYLPNPCSFSCATEKKFSGHRRKILWLARMGGEKQPQEAVKILEQVVKKLPDAQCVMVGGGNLLADVKKEIQKRNLGDNIVPVGAQIDCRKYYLDADVFLSTSEIEGFQMTLVEALSAGLPVVAYELSYIPPHCDENKGIVTVPMYDTFAAADAIVKLLEDDEYYADMSRKALKQAEKYCNFDFEAEWKKIFEAVCTDQVDSLIAPYISQDKNFRTFLQYFFLYLPIGSDKLIQKIKDPLNTKIRELTAAQTKAGRRIAEQDAQIAALNARVAELSQPWLKRKIKGGIRCLREHGFIYTVKRLFQKIGNKLCRK